MRHASGKASFYRLSCAIAALMLVACSRGGAKKTPRLACPKATEQRGDYLDAWCELPGGLKQGPQRSWWEPGIKSKAGSWDNGRRVGVWERWWPNGQLQQRGRYEDDRPVGLWEEWLDDGMKISSGSYDDNGQKHGRWFGWGPDGAITTDSVYEHGKIVEGKLYKDGKLWRVNGALVNGAEEHGAENQAGNNHGSEEDGAHGGAAATTADAGAPASP